MNIIINAVTYSRGNTVKIKLTVLVALIFMLQKNLKRSLQFNCLYFILYYNIIFIIQSISN